MLRDDSIPLDPARFAAGLQDRLLAVLALSDGDPGDGLRRLIGAGLDRLPLPGHGHTLVRWQALAAVAGHDLALAKLYEAQADALAILAECGPATLDRSARSWGVWCADPPDTTVTADSWEEYMAGAALRLTGRKPWCSGAPRLSHALVGCRGGGGERLLAAVALDAAGVRVTNEGWQAVGMGRTRSVDVVFDGAPAVLVGTPGQYLRRPGFWHGAAGSAACWWGAARAIGRRVHRAAAAHGEPHLHAHLGATDAALAAAAAMLREAAAWIDAHPMDDARAVALRVRIVVEQAVQQTLWHAGRALGAGPLCREPAFAALMADLPVFLRQSHAERDEAALAAALVRQQPSEAHAWPL
ncbi:acyl-CoA dehydrogenase [Xylophilus sp.]|uniref:acyl-CoA dehydrogenase n=1 Tax=Xylophilus sp. TaxID=2653893 RepID=UPI0013BDCE79|nr:acyl-CoA dehydrogenase [Xylophilus sp.]KAF1049871.1 MAG: hypothetical protein GAK38_00535 [Xylophilus sp.]